MTPRQAANGLNMRQQQAPAGSLLQPARLLRDGHSRTCAASSLAGRIRAATCRRQSRSRCFVEVLAG
eukprot:15037479-Alexandrium_andersonii.AAC.1